MIGGRVLQFARAVCARVSPEDRAFVERHLEPRLRPFFFDMSVPDQCHAIRTARNAARLAGHTEKNPDLPLLARCALLHDVGRKKGNLGTLGKSFAVLFAAACPSLSRAYGDGRRGEGVMARKMRVYFRHAEIGAELLLRAGFEREAAIVRRHHEAPAEDDPPELRILREADAMS